MSIAASAAGNLALPPCLPLQVADAPRGQIIEAVAAALDQMPTLVTRVAEGFALLDAGLGPAARSHLLQSAAAELRRRGLVPGWREERCALLDDAGGELARFERGAFRTLGLQNRAVHVNGFRADGRLWIARRSPTKASAPNMLDNMAAGAIVAGESPQACATRELWEEAGVPTGLAAAASFPGIRLRSLRPLPHGMHDEVLLCADLLLPQDFVPCCQDGEVAEFLSLTRAEVAHALAAGEFSIEAGMVVADWLARMPVS